MKTSSEDMWSSFAAAVIVAVLVYFVAGRVWWLALILGIGSFPIVFANTIYKVACSAEGFAYSRFFIKLATVSWDSITEVEFHPDKTGGSWQLGYMQIFRKDLKDVNVPTDHFSNEDMLGFIKLIQKKAPRAKVDPSFKELKVKQ